MIYSLVIPTLCLITTLNKRYLRAQFSARGTVFFDPRRTRAREIVCAGTKTPFIVPCVNRLSGQTRESVIRRRELSIAASRRVMVCYRREESSHQFHTISFVAFNRLSKEGIVLFRSSRSSVLHFRPPPGESANGRDFSQHSFFVMAAADCNSSAWRKL